MVLSRDMAAGGLCPAVDPLAASPTLEDPAVIGQRHQDKAEEVRRLIARYRDLRQIILLMGMEAQSAADRKAARLARFLAQPFAVTGQVNGQKGVSVAPDDVLEGCEAILGGETDAWQESALWMVGTIDDARAGEKAGA